MTDEYSKLTTEELIRVCKKKLEEDENYLLELKRRYLEAGGCYYCLYGMNFPGGVKAKEMSDDKAHIQTRIKHMDVPGEWIDYGHKIEKLVLPVEFEQNKRK